MNIQEVRLYNVFKSLGDVPSLNRRMLATGHEQRRLCHNTYAVHLKLGFFEYGTAQQRPVFTFSGFCLQERYFVVLRAPAQQSDQGLEGIGLASRMDLTEMQEPGQSEIQACGILILTC